MLLYEVQIVCIQGLGSKGSCLPRGAKDRSDNKDLCFLPAFYSVSLLLSSMW